MNILSTYDELAKAVADVPVVVIDGSRCSGKDYLISRLVESDPASKVYEILKPRKKWVESTNGKVGQLPCDLDMQQGHIWTMDIIRQMVDIRIIVNRGMLSSQHFDGPDSDRLQMWSSMLSSMSGKVILLHPPLPSLAKRIAKAGRQAESESIHLERNSLRRHAMVMDPALVLIFSESCLL